MTKNIVEIKYTSYITTEVVGVVDYIDEDVSPPEAVLVNGERIPLNTSDYLSPEYISEIVVIPDE